MAKKVMIIDDSATIRRQVAGVLTTAGYEVMEAEDGVDGLEKIATTLGLSLVICDVNMPRMSGIEMVSQVKSAGNNPNLIILMLTTEGQPDLITKAKAAGARGWMVKPFKPDQLLATVRKLAGAA